ncbi:Signal transduction histidine kinase [Sphingobacterium nematocida]|uniref:histidine kinase n=1 Tax=Sphingobacterium nematocida TaxID=1513896 RepID=A0A1T5AWW0_9SPHI|nr:PAS domain-containing sensor histidine kinase [Sphingobacterium nematocida]SKB39307.1 Signal transduction histidine kinase [Sphingobacterium nematocida]
MIQYDLDLLQVLEHSPLACAVYDNPDLRIAFVNDAMLTMWCAPKDILGKRFGEVFPGFRIEGFESILEKVWQSGITYRATDTPAVIVDGSEKHLRYFDFEYKALLDESGETYAILHTSTDVTTRVETNSKLRIQQEQLSFNNDLETLTHTLSHDVKNPLSVAKMGIHYLKNQKDALSANTLQWYDMIDQALINVENIINQTAQLSAARSIANIQNVHCVTAKIPAWCEEIKLLQPSFAGDIRLGQLLPIYGDIGAIYQIFMNIISNAIKYTAQIDNAEIAIYSEQTDKGVAYFIKDNGIGIPESELSKIFCVFSRASNAAEHHGTGIGLCLAKRIIERYGGSINVSSTEGKGTLVRLFFLDKGNSKS